MQQVADKFFRSLQLLVVFSIEQPRLAISFIKAYYVQLSAGYEAWEAYCGHQVMRCRI